MAYVHFDSSYAPCAVLIVRTGGDPYKEQDTVLVQTDWDYPGIAQSMGWSLKESQDHQAMCDHDGTNGTIKCPDCGRQALDFIQDAAQYVREYEGEEFEGLNAYFV